MSRKLSGLRAWYVQRLSAAYISFYVLIAVISMLFNGTPTTYKSWATVWSSPLVSTMTLLFFTALLIHAWIGIRDVILDYVHPFGARLVVLSLFAVMLITSGLWVARVLFNAIN
ncbi:succinate dehydrogenase, hydrophobic membrane anchor protein [Solemya velum gill symbiont]|uniref:succinate dehydrogenase, hydrophobic membrane anchor protein n=1 Tax=Solemya velum gill symbiont TaxID=2340 RepID=UPI0009CEE016|nr:succinate dehydrogenase, hydrophobic membrane anchor protein [Solemya velum gill symbiont]OOZ44029.1 succinate dehydrogenase, hydrophobic membrane anchor protein [Solemya velum gill symbiont]OOZ47829.1 succinate dehydrogenase, hydrophobic membrane anchor protein [Solemya velum gill symbiont]OOZ50311.1 succinate dehydrogenase, hydrophobic membrane anchor protein [Solemya velum gill symbiont]OOZ52787.1 succinate dehydrogenase, hydrophobic membrane anchor protein [Solemya velum gill symbiont]O